MTEPRWPDPMGLEVRFAPGLLRSLMLLSIIGTLLFGRVVAQWFAHEISTGQFCVVAATTLLCVALSVPELLRRSREAWWLSVDAHGRCVSSSDPACSVVVTWTVGEWIMVRFAESRSRLLIGPGSGDHDALRRFRAYARWAEAARAAAR